MVEFTGERLIPGQVSDDLLNEHRSRYVFAARLAVARHVLDAGCGAGYGSAELAHLAASVIGADTAADAIAFARENYRLPNLHFERASCDALPHPDGSFDLVVAFEVIEHLESWREFLLEVRRVLSPHGQFVVSTPNKSYYTESRGSEGPNPFHVHEFEFEEFRSELLSVFPEVALFLENHVEAIAFQPYDPAAGVEAHVDPHEPAPAESHFFVAVCGHHTIPAAPLCLYLPRAGNVLRERGRHIALLEEQLVRALREHQELLAAYRRQTEQLERSNQWAQKLNQEIEERRSRVVALQDELAQQQQGYQAKVKELEEDIQAAVQWSQDLESRLEHRGQELALAVEALHRTEKELEDRTTWARSLEEEKRHSQEQLRASRWMRIGRKFGLGPQLPG